MTRALLAFALAILAACGGERCPPVVVPPAEMTLARAAELAPGVSRGLAISTSIRATACAMASADAGAEAAPVSTCGGVDCGNQRRALDVLVLPSGVSIPRRADGCVRTRADLEPLAIARGSSSTDGELVIPVEAADVAVFLVDPLSGCAACGRLEAGEGCALTVPARGLVVRDLVLDRL